ncbi:Dabb family protein [Microlunatus antarcticus]
MSITHIVLVSWRDGEAEEAEAAVRPLVADFPQTIPDVVDVVQGGSSSPEGKEDGYDYALVVKFASPEARDVYLDHPAHTPVSQAIGAHAAKVLVFDV